MSTRLHLGLRWSPPQCCQECLFACSEQEHLMDQQAYHQDSQHSRTGCHLSSIDHSRSPRCIPPHWHLPAVEVDERTDLDAPQLQPPHEKMNAECSQAASIPSSEKTVVKFTNPAIVEPKCHPLNLVRPSCQRSPETRRI